MKVVIDAFSARQGGGQTYLINILRNVSDRMDIEVLVYAPKSLPLPTNHKIRRGKTLWPTTNPIARAIWQRFVLPKILREESADILFCPGGVLNTKAPDGCKTVTMFRNMIPFDQKVLDRLPVGLQRIRNWLLQRVMLNSMSLADCTIFISEYARELIQSKINVKRFATIYHGVSIDFRIGGRIYARPSLLPDGKYLLYVSRFDVYKHHFEVISAYSRLPLYLRQEYKLVLVGECDMPEAERALALIHQLELKDQVHVLGAIPYAVLPAFYAQAYAVLFASSCENCPNILLESLASGRPVMCSNVMPMPEFAGSSVSYFSPFDIDDIYKSMLRILEDKLYADTLAELSLKMSNMYNWEETAEATWKLILELHRT